MITSQFYSDVDSEKIPTPTNMAIKTIKSLLNAAKCSQKVLLISIIIGLKPPRVRPIMSKVLNKPIISRPFQSESSIKEIGWASRTPGKIKKDSDIPKNT